MSTSKNIEYKKTSFLSKSNSAFIEQMYLKFINKDSNLPESWKNYFLDIGEEIDLVVKEINGEANRGIIVFTNNAVSGGTFTE